MTTELEKQTAAVGAHLRTDERFRLMEQQIASLNGKCKRIETRISALQKQLDEQPPLRQRIAAALAGGRP